MHQSLQRASRFEGDIKNHQKKGVPLGNQTWLARKWTIEKNSDCPITTSIHRKIFQPASHVWLPEGTPFWDDSPDSHHRVGHGKVPTSKPRSDGPPQIHYIHHIKKWYPITIRYIPFCLMSKNFPTIILYININSYIYIYIHSQYTYEFMYPHLLVTW